MHTVSALLQWHVVFAKRYKACSIHWACNVKALSFVTGTAPHEIQIILCFYALGKYPHAEILCHRDDRRGQNCVVPVGTRMPRECLVYLETIDRKFLEIAQAGIASSKIINCHADAQGT